MMAVTSAVTNKPQLQFDVTSAPLVRKACNLVVVVVVFNDCLRDRPIFGPGSLQPTAYSLQPTAYSDHRVLLWYLQRYISSSFGLSGSLWAGEARLEAGEEVNNAGDDDGLWG